MRLYANPPGDDIGQVTAFASTCARFSPPIWRRRKGDSLVIQRDQFTSMMFAKIAAASPAIYATTIGFTRGTARGRG